MLRPPKRYQQKGVSGERGQPATVPPARGGCAPWCVPRSGLVHEGQRDALLRGRARRELEFAADALRELALDTRRFSRRARRGRRQALELAVERLRVFPVLQRERRAAIHGTGRDRRRDKGEGKHEL